MNVTNDILHNHKENGVDKEDLAGHNVFFAVALGLYAAIAPTCNGLYNPFQRSR